MDWGKAISGIGSLFTKGAQGIGSFATGLDGGGFNPQSALGGINIPNMIGKGANVLNSGINSFFNQGGNPNPGGGPKASSMSQFIGPSNNPATFGASGYAYGNGQTYSNDQQSGNVLSKLFKSNMGKGLAGIAASQLISDPKVPNLPDGYDQMYQQAMAGGTPASQSAQRYLQQVMSGENQGAYDAATQSVDQEYEQQLRSLDSMYKSLRPGTDLASDASYRRDRQQLDDQYMQRKAMVSAQVQQGAVGSAMQSGQNQMQNMALALQPQFDQQNQQWMADYTKRATLRNQLAGIAGGYAQNPQQSSFSQLFAK